MGTPNYHLQIPYRDYYRPLLNQQFSSFQVPISQDFLYQQRPQGLCLGYYQSTSHGNCFAFRNPGNHETTLDLQIPTPEHAATTVSTAVSESISGQSESATIVAPIDDGISECAPSSDAREKSKNAARTRRRNENIQFECLSHEIPLPATAKVMLDKASIVRLALNFLKMRSLFSSSQTNAPQSPVKQGSLSNVMLEALDGFPLILSHSGSVTYIGDTVKTQLGLAKWDLTEAAFAANVKEGERQELENHLRLTSSELRQINCPNTEFRFERRFTIHVKCILSKRNSGLTSEGYKALHYGGYLTARMLNGKEGPRKVVQQLCGIASTLPTVNWNSSEIRMGRDMFMFRASLDLKITYADEQLQFLTDYQARDIIDASLYQLVHVGDAEELAECHTTLLTKGQVITRYFRLLCKHGGWVWAQTHATILRNTRGSKSNCVIGVTYVLTRIQAPTMKFDVRQLQANSFATSNYGRALIIRPTNATRRKRPYPSQDAPQIGAAQSLSHCASNSAFFNPNFYQNLTEYVDGGRGDEWYINSASSTFCQPPPLPNHAGLISDAYANQSGIVVQQLTGIPIPALNVRPMEEDPYYGVSCSDTSVPSSSMPSSTSTNGYLDQLKNHQAEASSSECWQELSFYYQS